MLRDGRRRRIPFDHPNPNRGPANGRQAVARPARRELGQRSVLELGRAIPAECGVGPLVSPTQVAASPPRVHDMPTDTERWTLGASVGGH